MMDFAGEVAARNYNVRRETDAHHLFDLLRICGSLLAIAGVLFFYSWVRMEIVALGYAEQQLQEREQALQRAEHKLIAEEAFLENPQRIEDIARNELGMIPVRASQLLPAPIRTDGLGSTTVAEARALGPGSPSRKPSAAN